jgi:TrmH family RNA methyltransferase
MHTHLPHMNVNNSHISKAQVKWVRSLQMKKHRDEQDVFVAEGEKCVNDLRQSFELLLHITPDNASSTEIEQMSSLRTPQGVIGVFRKRKDQVPTPTKLSDGQLLLALDGIQDPGNLGTIIRTCDWFGIYDILCTKDTADCYNPKVVQATMGALARVRVHYVNNLSEVLAQFQTAGYPVYGTLLDGKNMYVPTAIPTKEKGIIVMGNEGNGISEDVRMLVTHSLLIPSYPANIPTSESLNVSIATAIVLAEFRRQHNNN